MEPRPGCRYFYRTSGLIASHLDGSVEIEAPEVLERNPVKPMALEDIVEPRGVDDGLPSFVHHHVFAVELGDQIAVAGRFGLLWAATARWLGEQLRVGEHCELISDGSASVHPWRMVF